MDQLISICIPTYQRPELLRQAIESCLKQTYSTIEIIIGDDSLDSRTEEIIQSFNCPDIIRYHHNKPSLGQADNVNRLFDLARGERLVLLHDDDLLLPTAIHDMAEQWEANPNLTACFGKQYLIDMDGNILQEASEELNEKHYRTSDILKLEYPAVWSALVGQFPNNGYLILTRSAKDIKYSLSERVGNICDYDFGLRLASKYGNFRFIDQYTSMVRATDISISQSHNNSDLSYQLIESVALPDSLASFRQERLKLHAVPAVSQWIATGNKAAAFKVYRSEYYSWKSRLSLKGLVHALLLCLPKLLGQSFFKVLKNT
jgi:glycosyltransferase involved in cell wall biosynthesis